MTARGKIVGMFLVTACSLAGWVYLHELRKAEANSFQVNGVTLPKDDPKTNVPHPILLETATDNLPEIELPVVEGIQLPRPDASKLPPLPKGLPLPKLPLSAGTQEE